MKNFKLWGSVGAIIILVVLGMIYFGGKKDGGTPSDKAPAPITDADWVRGNRQAKVVLIEYSDFQCPACRAYFPTVKSIEERFGEEKLAVVYRHFPLVQIHFNAALAAQAAEAAGIQGKFWDIHDKLFEGQETWATGNARDAFISYARELGLDEGKFVADMDARDTLQKVSDSYKEGRELGVAGTPTFFLNGTMLDAVRSPQELEAAVTSEIERQYPEAI